MMKNLIKIVFFCLFSLSGCALSAKEKRPYLVYGEMVTDESAVYDFAGLHLYLMNKSEKNIESFTLVFYLFDQDGNPPEGMRNNIVFSIDAEIESMDSIETDLSLDKYLYSIPEEPYLVDYLYLSKITYDDGTVWSDPFGMN